MSVIALIPARGGSKAIPRKNLVLLRGRPLIAYAIDAARNAGRIDRVIVSTDDDEIAAVAKSCGAEVPFMRPPELAGDTAPMLGVMQHALAWHEKEHGAEKAIVLLQPTSPLRTSTHIDEAVTLFLKEKATSVVSVIEVPHQFNPVSVMTLEAGLLQPLMVNGPAPLRRQDKPPVYARNGPAILVSAPATLNAGDLYGSQCRPYLMRERESLDIDTPDDLAYAEWLLSGAHG